MLLEDRNDRVQAFQFLQASYEEEVRLLGSFTPLVDGLAAGHKVRQVNDRQLDPEAPMNTLGETAWSNKCI